jgi:BarA-like signal transduction histidine kinase
MQPLDRVKPDAVSAWGDSTYVAKRPKVAAKIAECIAAWAEIETTLGVFLAFLLHTNANAVIAMYSSVENRSSQLRMIDSAAKAQLPAHHYDVFSVLMTVSVRPAMKERDKLAHWSWGYADELVDALLITEPSDKIVGHHRAVQIDHPDPAIPASFSVIFVVTEADLTRMADRFRKARDNLLALMGSVWSQNTPQQRAECLRTLSNEPEIQAGLTRLHEGRQKNQEAQ